MNTRYPLSSAFSFLPFSACALGVLLSPLAHANFVNGDFEASPDFSGWSQSGYSIPAAIPTFPPQAWADLGLILDNANIRSAILGAGQEALTNNALAWTDRVARVHTANSSTGIGRKASAIEQTITLAASDFDALDNQVHVRFVAAPVLEDPGHAAEEQPYFFIEITKADGTRLFQTFNFANQAGVPWVTFGGIKYTDWQAFDIALDPALVAAGDAITLKVVAAGCGPSGHAGSVYLNNVRTSNTVNGASLWVNASAPAAVARHTNPDGSTDITYTYQYTNNGNTAVTNVVVKPAMPVATDGTSTRFVAIGTPTHGSCAAPADGVGSTNEALCTLGTLAPGLTGSFTMTVRVPASTLGDQVNNGTYPIQGTNVPLLLGPLVKTSLLADLVPDLSQLPAGGGSVGVAYPPTASFSCVNQGSTTAIGNTLCSINNLPPGVTVGQCTVSPPTPGKAWQAGDAVPPAAVVNCPVSGTPTGPAPAPLEVVTGSDNDGTPGNNTAQLVPVAPAPAPAPAPEPAPAPTPAPVPTPVPTLSEWAMLLIAGSLAGLGVRRRSGV